MPRSEVLPLGLGFVLTWGLGLAWGLGALGLGWTAGTNGGRESGDYIANSFSFFGANGSGVDGSASGGGVDGGARGGGVSSGSGVGGGASDDGARGGGIDNGTGDCGSIGNGDSG